MKYCVNAPEESFRTFLDILNFDYVSTSTHFKLVDLIGRDTNYVTNKYYNISGDGLFTLINRLYPYIDKYIVNDFLDKGTLQCGVNWRKTMPYILSYEYYYYLAKRLIDEQDRIFYRHIFKALDNPAKYFKVLPNIYFERENLTGD